MKRWTSLLVALTTFAVVLSTAFYALITSKVVLSDAAASPVFASSESANNLPKTSYENAKQTLQTYGVQLELSPAITYAGKTFKAASSQDPYMQTALTMLVQEWNKYTPSFIKNTGLKKIYFVTELNVGSQQRAGMPEPIFEDALYFDVSKQYVLSENGAYMRRTLHHEFKHLIDYNTYGTYSGNKEAWNSCSAVPAQYGNGGGSMYNDPEFSHAEHPEEGFVNGYATSAIEEDMAEVYARLMTTPEKLQALANNDPIIACKVSVTRETLAVL